MGTRFSQPLALFELSCNGHGEKSCVTTLMMGTKDTISLMRFIVIKHPMMMETLYNINICSKSKCPRATGDFG